MSDSEYSIITSDVMKSFDCTLFFSVSNKLTGYISRGGNSVFYTGFLYISDLSEESNKKFKHE